MAAADLNGDGKVEPRRGQQLPDEISVLANRTPAGATVPRFAGAMSSPAGEGPYSVAASDLNSDGKPDLVTANYNAEQAAGGNTVLINVTEPGAELPDFTGPTPFTTGDDPISVAASALNGDGRPDLATANNRSEESGGNTVLLNTTPFPFAAGPSSLALRQPAERDHQRAADA